MKVLLFASLRERLNTAEILVDKEPDIRKVRDVLSLLQSRGEAWHEALQPARLRVAINQELAAFDDPVSENDEIAFFPPVTGG